jgi:predicted lipoprotein with Yx(FWY)xxD motif
MHRTATRCAGALAAAALIVGLVAAFYVARSSGANGTSSLRVVMTAKNKTLGKTVLVNRKGLTLYSLSVERGGHFVCTTSACVSLWTPLTVPRRTTPTGVAHLAVVRRPNGRLQVAYRGGPLYTFRLDAKPGDVKGNGFKDVGVWRPASVSAQAPAAAPPTTTGGGYGGGYGP